MNKHCKNLQSKIKLLNYAMLIKVNLIITNAFFKHSLKNDQIPILLFLFSVRNL